jgi:hypothetical protein
MTHIFFHPDYTVGPGISPDLLTLQRVLQALAGSAMMAIPPVGNRTPPRRRIGLLVGTSEEDCSRTGESLPAAAV